MKALEDGPPAVAAGFGVLQTEACRTRHGLRGRRYAVSSLELVGRGGLGRRLLDGLGELEVVVVITAGPYHEFIEAAEAAIPVVGYLYHVSFYVRGQC